MKLASIDIGSNAIRLQVSKVVDPVAFQFKKIEYIRFPLRLGQDVFTTGEISPPTEERFVKLMLAFKQFLELYEVDDYMVCATSAMREAHNGNHIAKRIYYSVGVRIHIIDGEEEGNLLNRAVYQHLDMGHYMHIDVGGGSTEVSFVHNREKIAVRSFRMGSVRQLAIGKEEQTYEKMREWIALYAQNTSLGPLRAIGTGGNIKKMAELSAQGLNTSFSVNQLEQMCNALEACTFEERMKQFNLNPDRADVIVPASKIYLSILQMAGASDILIPDVGLKDGIIMKLFDKHYRKTAGIGR